MAANGGLEKARNVSEITQRRRGRVRTGVRFSAPKAVLSTTSLLSTSHYYLGHCLLSSIQERVCPQKAAGARCVHHGWADRQTDTVGLMLVAVAAIPASEGA